MSAAEKLRGVIFAFEDYAVSVVKAVCARDLGDVRCLTAEKGHSLVAGHMETQSIAVDVGLYKIVYGGFHCSSSSSILEAATMMAHSMRLRKRSQPYLYMPLTEPVA